MNSNLIPTLNYKIDTLPKFDLVALNKLCVPYRVSFFFGLKSEPFSKNWLSEK